MAACIANHEQRDRPRELHASISPGPWTDRSGPRLKQRRFCLSFLQASALCVQTASRLSWDYLESKWHLYIANHNNKLPS